MHSHFVLRGGSRESITFGAKLGEGAAGTVWALPRLPGKAAKLYKSPADAAEYAEKISLMLINRPKLPDITVKGFECRQIAWPEAEIIDGKGRFAGFIMPEIDFKHSCPLESALQRNSRRADGIQERYELRIILATNLASVFAELHRAGHYMIDMKPDNLRIYPNHGYLAVVDTDGFSIRGADKRIPSNQFTDNYIAPEGRGRAPKNMGEDQDRFALAVIIFQLLNNGLHPYSGVPKAGTSLPSDLQSRIYSNLYAYGRSPHKAVSPAPSSIHASFDDGTQTLFDRAFLGGGGRPTAREWRDHLQGLLKNRKLITCAANREHVHFGKGCGLCEHERRIASAKAKAAKSRAQQRTAKGGVGIQIPFVPSPPIWAPPQPPPTFPTTYKPNLGNWGKVLGWILAIWFLGSVASCITGAGRRVQGNVQATAPSSTPVQPVVESFSTPRRYALSPGGPGDRVILRAGPTATSGRIALLSAGEELTGTGSAVDEAGDTWIAVTRSDGTTGFIASRFLTQLADAPPQPTERPSFDCSRATAWDGLTICANPRLAILDREMATVFTDLRNTLASTSRQELVRSQADWIRARALCQNDSAPEACLERSMNERLGLLRSWPRSDPETYAPATSYDRAPEPPAAPPRNRSGSNSYDQGTREPEVTCIMPGGQEAQLTMDECRRNSGVVYR